MTNVTILPVDLSADVHAGDSLLDAGVQAGVEMQGGCFEGAGGECVVEIVSGMSLLTPPRREEIEALKRRDYSASRYRLACCTRIASTAGGTVVIRQLD